MTVHVPVPQDRLAAFCQQYHIRRLAFFGSVLRADFRSDSDVDVLVEFEPEFTPGFLRLATMEQELSDLVGRRVDLRTPQDLSSYFRDDVLALAETQWIRLTCDRAASPRRDGRRFGGMGTRQARDKQHGQAVHATARRAGAAR